MPPVVDHIILVRKHPRPPTWILCICGKSESLGTRLQISYIRQMWFGLGWDITIDQSQDKCTASVLPHAR